MPAPPLRQTGVEGTLERYEAFPSEQVTPRPVDVWLPPGYGADPERRHPVLYMHDGQNLFLPELSFSGIDWGVDEALHRLIERGDVPAPVVVGIWNTPHRLAEYMPQQPLETIADPKWRARFIATYGEAPCSDRYLAFLVHELKPFIDAAYRTCPHPRHTWVMGSSMGGLISLYALCQYPDVFSAAGCLSPSWTVAGRVLVPYLRQAIPAPGAHRVYFDFGVEAHIGKYEAYQRKVHVLFQEAGYRPGLDLMTRRFPGATHSEQAWRERLEVPLRFLMAT